MAVGPKPLEGTNVLVVEDDYLIATELCLLLRSLGAGVVGPVASLPPESPVAGKAVDVALLDVKLGSCTSFGLADDMVRRGIPVALITGHAPRMLPPPYRTLRRLDKPIERGELITTILGLTGQTEHDAA